MGRIKWMLGVSGLAVLLALGGCNWSGGFQNKPPKMPEEFRAPPDSEARYNAPIDYPKKTMDQDQVAKKAAAKTGTPGPMRNGMRGGPGGF